jgi:cysteine-rich repeat protein
MTSRWRILVLCLPCLQCGDDGGGAATDTATDTEDDDDDESTSTGEMSSSSTGPEIVCGNGVVDEGEDCDDGNTLNGDDCTADCHDGQQELYAVSHDQGNGTDCAEGVAVDGEGNIIVAGFVLTAGAGENVWVRKYTPELTPMEGLWTQSVDGPGGGDDRARGIAANAAGEIVVVGFLTGTGAQGRNIWVRSYDADGNELWNDVVDGPSGGDDQAYGVAAMEDGWVVSGELFVGTGDTDVWLRRYDAAGEEVWTQTFAGQGAGLDSGRDVDVGPGGEIVVTGWESSEMDGRSAWTRKYNAEGQAEWTVRYNAGSTAGNQGQGVAVGIDGTIVVAGMSREGSDPTLFWNQGYDANGNETWTELVGQFTSQPAIGRGAAAGYDGQFSTVGQSTDEGSAESKTRVVRYEAGGDQLWQQGFTGLTGIESQGYAIDIGPDDTIAFAGCDFSLGDIDSGNIFVARMRP